MIKSDAYLIKDTHLRLGSKIHITDFVFAKRLFQKSAYASKFAYNIAKNISEIVSDKNQEIVLIGYAYYSELLASRTELILKNVFHYKHINHIIIDNEKEINYSFYFKSLFPAKCINDSSTGKRKILYCILTPISSTLTTPIKLENEFYRQVKKYCSHRCPYSNSQDNCNNTDSFSPPKGMSTESIKETFDFTTIPFQTIIVVGNKKINDNYKTVENTKINSFNFWKEIKIKDDNNKDVKEIVTYNRLLEDDRRNQFHIYVKSKWHNIHNCKVCFPDNLLEEKPLFEADKTLLTPEFIYDLPQNQEIHNSPTFKETIFQLKGEIDKNISNPQISSKMIKYGHFRGKNKHFFYYLKYLDFYEGNKLQIIEWAKKIRKLYFPSLITKQDRILLITPDKSTSGQFAFTINRYVFNEACNIISFNPHEENISNFEKFFSNWILHSSNYNIHVFYVDNLIALGNTAMIVHDAVKLVRQKQANNNINQPGLAGIFSMVNRLGEYENRNIKRKLNNKSFIDFNDIFSFATLNFPIIRTITNEKGKETGCYLCDSLENYKLLANECSLDNIKQYLIIQNLKKREIKSKFDEELHHDNSIEDELRLKRLCISHFLYKSFGVSELVVFFEKKQELNDFQLFRVKFRDYFLNNSIYNDFSDHELKCVLIKVLSEPPFILYRNIKRTIFSWLLTEYDVTINKIANFPKNYINDHASLHYLRLLIKKGSQLNINYLISKESLIQIFKIASLEKEIIEFRNKLSNKPERDKFDKFLNFRLFVIASFKESLFKNEHKSIRFEETLKDEELSNIISTNSYTRRLYESFVLENTGVIKQAYKAIIDILDNPIQAESINNKDFETRLYWVNTLKELYEKGDNKVENLFQFLDIKSISSMDEKLFSPFINSLNLYRFLKKNLLTTKNNNGSFEVSAKNILKYLSKTIGINEETGGAFFLVKYQDISDDPFSDANLHVLANYGKSAPKTVKKLEESNKTFTKLFLKGHDFEIQNERSNYSWTALGAYKENERWSLQSSTTSIGDEFDSFEEANINNNSNRYFYYRICNWDINKKHISSPQAILVFYDNEGIPFEPHVIRYALTVKNEISEFIKSRFENDAFKAYVESEKKNQEYVKRYIKNTHGVYKRMNKMIDIASQNPNLYAIYSDIFIGQIHYSMLIKTKIEYETEIDDLSEIFNPKYLNLISDLLISSGFIESNIIIDRNSFSRKGIYYNRFTKFIFFQLFNNIISYTEESQKCDAIVNVFADNNYIVVTNSHSKITGSKVSEIITNLNSTVIPLDSISLFVINRFCKNMCINKRNINSLLIEMDNDSTFVLKIPLIAN